MNVCFSPVVFTVAVMFVLSAGALAGYVIGALFAVGGRT
jgi:hypothetical protein